MIATSSTVFYMVTQIMVYSIESPSPTSIPSLRKIPGEGISWKDQREDNYLYADKSVYLERLLENEGGNIFFYITRPRGFGKSSFLTMAKYFFNGDKILFKGLKINDRGNTYFFKEHSSRGVPKELRRKKWIQCPVIYLDFRKIENFNNMIEFKTSYTQKLRDIAESYGLNCSLECVPSMDITDLIFELEFKFKLSVVVLVDEYDSPFRDALENLKNRALAEEIRRFLDNLFGALKSDVEKLRLVLILGVSRLRLNGGPNNYIDLTYEEEFAGGFGFTSEEIKNFHPEIRRQFNLNKKEEINKFLDKLKKEYDGYNFTYQYINEGKKNVLNPISTLKCLEKKKFGCYWSETNNVNEIIRRLYFSKEPLEALEHSKLSIDNIEEKRNPAIESIPLEILMLLHGYFTIESYNEETNQVFLNFPNNEIKIALQRNINEYKPHNDIFLSEEYGWLYELKWHMETGRVEGSMNTLTNLFDTHFSKTIRQETNEFSSTARLIDKLQAARIFCCESKIFIKENSSRDEAGDVDILTRNLEKNFIMSIKYGYSGTIAMNTLINYLRKHRTTFLQLINEPDQAWFVGINFDSRTGGTLQQWIAIPFEKGDLRFDQCKASFPNLCNIYKRQNGTQL